MLVYTGGYGGALAGIPARDLTDDEVERHGGEKVLLATGLYKRVENKSMSSQYENKLAAKTARGE